MGTVVKYTDREAAVNRYPDRIVSPSRSGPCCFTDMELVGQEEREGSWVYRYSRCAACGYTVRVVVRRLPDVELASDLRKLLERSFVRNVPER
jgi:hypothetical protein